MTTADGDYLEITPLIRIPTGEFEIELVRSSGPGGQNVNKVNSKVRLHWPLLDSTALPGDVRDRLIEQQGSRLTTAGVLILSSQHFRDQHRNRKDCFDRLRTMILEALHPPKPRRKTKPTQGSRRRRLAAKRMRSETKRLRGKPSNNDF